MNSAPPCAPPSSSRHLERIDVLRAVAILLVVVSHTLPWVIPGERDFSLLGIAGVALFFVVSGFCIHLSAVGAAASLYAIVRVLACSAGLGAPPELASFRCFPSIRLRSIPPEITGQKSSD